MVARIFGSPYADHPDVLMGSLEAMNAGYRQAPRGKLALALQRFYVRVFGVPEVGVQVRAMHFQRIIRKLPLMSYPRILDAGCGIGA